MTDYGCYPLWFNDNKQIGNINPETLPISDKLKKNLYEWADEYDKILNQDNPASSDFPTKEDSVNFYQAGLLLQERLQTELQGRYIVTYKPFETLD